MKLEINLVKKQSVDSGLASLISRERYSIENKENIMTYIQNFISDQTSTFAAAIRDPRLNSILSNIKNLTWNQLDCLRYILSIGSGLDIWYWMTANEEINLSGVDNGIYEYNILDFNNQFMDLPVSSKIEQSQQDNNLTKIYMKINDSYDLFSGDLFVGIANPLKTSIDAAKASMELIGKLPQVQSSNINFILSFLHKEIRVIVA